MGRIRKTLAITTTIATGGVPLVRWRSSAEKAAVNQSQLLKEQNDLLAKIAQDAKASPRPPTPVSVRLPHVGIMCCLDCVNLGCDKKMADKIGWTRVASKCDCPDHHGGKRVLTAGST